MATLRTRRARQTESRSGMSADAAYQLIQSFMHNGSTYPFGLNMTMPPSTTEQIPPGLEGYVGQLLRVPSAFAAQRIRGAIMGQTRLQWKTTSASATPGKLFGNQQLSKFERPWPGATSIDLFTRMEWHAGCAGNAYVVDLGHRLRVARPDWMAMIFGSEQEPDDAANALDGELLGYVWQHGGIGNPASTPVTFMPDKVAHWAPIPDPLGSEIGISWLTPVLRDMQADQLSTRHKIKFYENGATPNLVVKGITSPDGRELTPQVFSEIVKMLDDAHAGVENAYKTLYLSAGADATVVGANMEQLDFANTTGKGENRIAVASGVPAPILSISEGFSGSGLQSGFYGSAKRVFADTWYTPQAQSGASALEHLVDVPELSELSFDPKANQFLQEDRKDEADILVQALSAIRTGVEAGFDPDAVVTAVRNSDLGALAGKHTGLTSVQLQPPNAGDEAKSVEVPVRDVAALLDQGWTLAD